jgi:hypothetical protein
VTKIVILLGVSRAAVSEIMSVYMNHGKTISMKRNSGRKSTLTERDHCTFRRTVSKNRRITAAQVIAEQNIHLKILFPQKLSDMSFTNPTSTVGLHLLNL